jgi:hypothetical protein
MLGRQIRTAESLVLEYSSLEVNTAVEKLKRPKSPGIDHIPEELIQAEGKTCAEIHKLTDCI